MKLLGITQSAFDPASRFRFIQFIPYLREAGWEVDHRPNRPDRQWQSPLRWRPARALHYRAARLLMRANRLRDAWDARHFDVVFVNRDFASEGPWMQNLLTPVTRRSVFDFDDAIFVGPREKLVRRMCSEALWITPGNEYLADYARQFNSRVTVIPTVIDTDSYRPRSWQSENSKAPVRVGWSGSDQSIYATLTPRLPMLLQLQQRLNFELVVITNTRPRLSVPGLRWSFHPWQQQDEGLLESRFDIGIMPLIDDTFQKGKCALKLLQYMAAGLPAVASPVGVNQDVVRHCVTGMLAKTDEEWSQALEYLVCHKEARAAMGTAGRKRCEEEYSIRRWLPVLLDIFKTVRQEVLSRPAHNVR